MNRKKVSHTLNTLGALGCALLLSAGVVASQESRTEGAPPAAKEAARKPQPRKKTDAGKTAAGKADATAATAATTKKAAGDPVSARLAEIQKLAAWERVAELEDFLEQELPDAVELRALEQLVSSLAAHADERLTAGDTARALELFRRAVGEAPADMTDKLFVEVVSQFPGNLYLRGQQEASFDLARRIERRVKAQPRRLLALAPFYLSVERPDDAARVAAAAAKLAPEMPAARLALAAALRQSLKLEEAAGEYARALELDPKSAVARQSLADLRRATGRSEDALALYRGLVEATPANTSARNGVVLSLFDAGRRDEAEREFAAALKDDPKNLPLLAGAAYWHAARGDAARALDLAERAVRVEPRHPWAQVALARALVAAKRPLEAERALRFARLHSRFPTLDYELANALAAAGLYEEAAEMLAQSFTIREGRVAARLGGRFDSEGASFVELLAPERRASFFQPGAAETEENARRLKALLALHAASRAAEKTPANEAALAEAAAEFAGGDDEMRAFRQLYAANRLLRRGVALPAALALVESARESADAGLKVPFATVAALADELRDVRARAITQGATPDVPAAPPDVLAGVMRGRIEEARGWTLFNQNRFGEAVAALRQAVGLLPESSIYWRSAQWRLGVALASSGNNTEALASYIKAYDPNRPDPTRRAVITALYRKVHGTASGLDLRLRSATQPQTVASAAPSREASPAPRTVQPETAAPPAPADAKRDEVKLAEVEAKSAEPEPKPAEPETKKTEAEVKKADDESAARAAAPPLTPLTPVTEPSPSPSPVSTPSPEATPVEVAPTPAAVVVVPTLEPSPTPTPEAAKAAEASPTADAAKTDEGKTAPAETAGAPAAPRRTRRTYPTRPGKCSLAVSNESLALASNGGSGTVVARLEGGGDLSRLTAETPNWSDIVVMREPLAADAAGEARFTVSSISKTAGSFTVTLKSPCGAKEIGVTVK